MKKALGNSEYRKCFYWTMIMMITGSELFGQTNSGTANYDYIFFPSPLIGKAWHSSIGFTLTEMPVDITEEAQFRAPAIDFHVLRRLGKGYYLDGRINSQIVQNHTVIKLLI